MKKNTRWTIHNQDVMKWAEEYEGEKFHALLTDAPYHLTTITKRFGKNGSAPAKFGKDGVFQRASKGFMGQDWDGGDISFRPETWAALGKHLYPGAFGMTFGGSRTAHRIAVAIEDAGFIIHPMIVWVYGSGFPKATRVKGHKEFDGHRYGMQALKPAAEPIIVFSKSEDECYNSLKVELDKTNILLEELWNSLAKSQKEIDSAGHGVNMILSRVLNLQDQTLRVSGSIVGGVNKQHTKHQGLSNGTVAKGVDTAQRSATKHLSKAKQKGSVNSVKKNSTLRIPSTKERIVVENVLTLREKNLCWKTPLEMGIDTNTLADMLQSNLVKAKLDLSMIWLWRLILVDLYEVGSKSTIETAKKMTIELAILNYLLHKLMQKSQGIRSEKNLSEELWYVVQDVVRSFIGLSIYQVERELPVRSVSSQPIIVFQKPYDGKSVDNIVSSGAGALNIEAGRIPLADGDGYVINTFDDGAKPFGGGAGHKYTSRKVLKYKPKGIRSGSGNYIGDNYTTLQSEVEVSGRWPANFVIDDVVAPVLDAQSGASRYFYNVQTQLDNADPFFYAKKANGKERNAGLSEKNVHPTVKPIDLTRYIASLLLPPDVYAPRRILVPFSGSGSEMIGCLLAGWEYVEAIELGKEYCKIGEKRLRHWVK